MPIVLIDNYDSFTYNLFQLVQSLTEEPVEVYRNDAIDFQALNAFKPSRVILSPGPGHPKNPADFGVCTPIIEYQAQLDCPILGVCLGHQGIAHHFGARIETAPEILHGKTSSIQVIESSPLLKGLPNPFRAMRYHSLIVSNENLPDCLQVTAREMSQNLIMALQHRERPVYGAQFHPESIGTPEGKTLLKNFIEHC
jgi:anthranilate synthase component II